MRISDWSSDVCSSDLRRIVAMRDRQIEHRDPFRQRNFLVATAGIELSDARRPVQQVRIDAARAQVVDEATRIQRGDDAAGRRNFSVVGHSVVISGSEEHTSELQSLMRISYAVFCLKKKTKNKHMRQYTIKRHEDTELASKNIKAYVTKNQTTIL